jgi:hypothetical protein
LPNPLAGGSTASSDANDVDVNKFIGQDGRERVVPTGPPPTDSEGRLELTFDDLSFEMDQKFSCVRRAPSWLYPTQFPAIRH